MCSRLTGGLFIWAALLSSTVISAPPFRSLMPFRKIEADPRKVYLVREENGPWLILCASFSGPSADRQARELVYELRKRFKLEAFMHARRYDFSRPVTGLGLNAYGRPRMMRHERSKTFDEVAVMVGDFESVDDSKAQRALDKIKHLRPDALDLKKRRTNQPFAVWRYVQTVVQRDPDKKKKGPMGKAFMTRNPLIPAAYFTQRGGVDDFVYRMNKNVEHSLLKNQARFTVRVASFRGEVMLDAEKNFKPNRRITDKLEQAALKAHRLTEALRAKGVDAFEFHDRHESIVTVGGFESIGQPRRDGKIDINPSVLRIMQTYGAQQQALPGQPVAGLRPKTLAGIPFDVQAVPVAVPRVAIGSRYAKRRYQR